MIPLGFRNVSGRLIEERFRRYLNIVERSACARDRDRGRGRRRSSIYRVNCSLLQSSSAVHESRKRESALLLKIITQARALLSQTHPVKPLHIDFYGVQRKLFLQSTKREGGEVALSTYESKRLSLST